MGRNQQNWESSSSMTTPEKSSERSTPCGRRAAADAVVNLFRSRMAADSATKCKQRAKTKSTPKENPGREITSTSTDPKKDNQSSLVATAARTWSAVVANLPETSTSSWRGSQPSALSADCTRAATGQFGICRMV